ncbi:hypothetical protein KY289_000851 [Solanum tuberosum]|nr:hypothetical protein KY289_000851 [Solanum tuberosum]
MTPKQTIRATKDYVGFRTGEATTNQLQSLRRLARRRLLQSLRRGRKVTTNDYTSSLCLIGEQAQISEVRSSTARDFESYSSQFSVLTTTAVCIELLGSLVSVLALRSATGPKYVNNGFKFNV